MGHGHTRTPPGYPLELCSMLISAIVVEEFGMAPYWFLSRTLMTVGITKPSTTSTSASLETQGARDLGLNSFLMSTVGFCLGRGVTSAIFQMVGRRCSVWGSQDLRDGIGHQIAVVFQQQVACYSGPQAFRWLRTSSVFCKRGSVTLEDRGRVRLTRNPHKSFS